MSYGMAQPWSPRKTPSKFVDVCCICSKSFSFVKNNLNHLLGHDLSVQLDCSLALEAVTRCVTLGAGLPKAINVGADVMDAALLWSEFGREEPRQLGRIAQTSGERSQHVFPVWVESYTQSRCKSLIVLILWTEYTQRKKL